MGSRNHSIDVSAQLREHGIFPTGQRLSVARLLLTEHQHVTADQLHVMLRNQGVQISKATVYNTLNLFAEKGLIREIVVDATHTYFDSNSAPHHHFYNLDEGKLIDSPEPLCALLPSAELPPGTKLEEVDVVVKIRNLG